jgi:hypothetical protein
MVEEAERMKLNILYPFFLTFLHVSCSLNQRKYIYDNQRELLYTCIAGIRFKSGKLN